MRFEQDDYVFVPKGLAHRFVPDDAPQYWLTVECHGGLWLPKQWRNEVGQLRMDAPYCHRDFRRPEFEGPRDEGIRDVVVKRGGRFHGFRQPHSPLDVVGWDGTVYPWAFPILNFQPRAGLVHLPPTWHGTFAARGALICSFVPRVVDFHPEAIPCPYPHSSVDVDELLFYCRGNFTSRKGVGPGSISHHPPGIPHGPHPGSYEKSIGTARTDELAVMIDAIRAAGPDLGGARRRGRRLPRQLHRRLTEGDQPPVPSGCHTHARCPESSTDTRDVQTYTPLCPQPVAPQIMPSGPASPWSVLADRCVIISSLSGQLKSNPARFLSSLSSVG